MGKPAKKTRVATSPVKSTKRAAVVDATVLHGADNVVAALRQYFSPPAWAMFTNVSNATGYRADRWADALAVSLWPSRGLHLHGVEIKVSRSDLLRELKDPKKAESIADHCDFWWIAVSDASIAKVDELPAPWGLLVPKKNGGSFTMRIAKQAKQLKPKALTREFAFAILRRAAEQFDPEVIRKQAEVTLNQKLLGQIEASHQENHRRDIETLEKRLATAVEAEKLARKQLQAATQSSVDPASLQKALRCLSLLGGSNGFNGGASGEIRRILGLLKTSKAEVEHMHAYLTEAATLIDDICDGKPEESEPEGIT